MRPNLKSCNATVVEFTTAIPLADDIISKIKQISKPDRSNDSLFFDSYSGNRAIIIVREITESKKDFKIDFVFESLSGGRLTKRHPRIDQFVDITSSIKENLEFDCRAAFLFGKNTHTRSIINLPMKYIEFPDMPFDLIQGLHLVKLNENKPKYEIYFDAPSKGVLFENITFKYSSKLSDSLAEKILNEAKTISSKVVFKDAKNI